MSQATTTIEYASVVTNIGTVLIATFDAQIYSILLGDTEQEPLQDLHDYAVKHLGQTKLLRADNKNKLLFNALALLKNYLNAPSLSIYKQMQELPLYVEGTEFQKKVWTALRDIPVGKTASYSDIANSIGSPKAVRAVASACAHNRHGIIVPCHRVLRSDGGISGYRWGVERKKQIIALEAKA